MKIIVISCSLHPQSRSRVLARHIVETFTTLSVSVEFYDLQDYSLDFCDAVTAHKTPQAEQLITAIRQATVVLMAVPIYNYDVNSAAKNLLELGLSAWNHKLVGFMCAAGGRNSYMSVMGLANSLMLDFRCLIIPRFVYATGVDFGDDRSETMYVASDTIQTRLQELAEMTVVLASALDGVELLKP